MLKICHIHNHYRGGGGKETMFSRLTLMQREKGHQVVTFERDSRDVKGFWFKTRGFVQGIYFLPSKLSSPFFVQSSRLLCARTQFVSDHFTVGLASFSRVRYPSRNALPQFSSHLPTWLLDAQGRYLRSVLSRARVLVRIEQVPWHSS